LPQLFAPQSEGFVYSIPDPRRPAALTGDDFDGPNVSRLARGGGNPNLGPETGRARQFGVVWSPRSAPGLSLEAGWFRYDLEDLIATVGTGYVLDNELGGLGYLVVRQPGTETYVNRPAYPGRFGPALAIDRHSARTAPLFTPRFSALTDPEGRGRSSPEGVHEGRPYPNRKP
jgi:outer membrane receptor protein involved in Fe transport